MPELQLPTDRSLPFFAYGLLQPEEWGFRKIEECVIAHATLVLRGAHLLERDGLPLLVLDGGTSVVRGHLLSFATPGDQAYGRISKFEPAELYKWERVETQAGPANTLVGRHADKGTVPFDDDSWNGHEDAFFRQGIEAVRQISEYEVVPDDPLTGMFRLEAAYLLVWSILERYATLAHGPALGANARINALGGDRRFAGLLKKHVAVQVGGSRRTRLFQSNDPRESHQLDVDRPVESARYFYLIRNNISHRGKEAWRDAETIRAALGELLAIAEELTD